MCAINDLFGQNYSPASSDHYSYLKINCFVFRDIEMWGRA